MNSVNIWMSVADGARTRIYLAPAEWVEPLFRHQSMNGRGDAAHDA